MFDMRGEAEGWTLSQKQKKSIRVLCALQYLCSFVFKDAGTNRSLRHCTAADRLESRYLEWYGHYNECRREGSNEHFATRKEEESRAHVESIGIDNKRQRFARELVERPSWGSKDDL